MNTTNILLATTSLLIVVAFALSFQGLSKNRNNPESKDEIALLKEEMDNLAAERRAFELSQMRASAPAPTPAANPSPGSLAIDPGSAVTEIENDKLKELEEANRKLQEANDALEDENEMVNEERNEIKRKQMEAAKRVQMALKMGTVVSANKESGFVIFKPSPSSPTHQPGKILSVRRNSGILGEIQIDRLDETGQYVATMRPQVFAEDNYPDILPGDEIIRDPDK